MAYEQGQKLYDLAVSEKDGEAQEKIGCCLRQAVCAPADCSVPCLPACIMFCAAPGWYGGSVGLMLSPSSCQLIYMWDVLRQAGRSPNDCYVID